MALRLHSVDFCDGRGVPFKTVDFASDVTVLFAGSVLESLAYGLGSIVSGFGLPTSANPPRWFPDFLRINATVQDTYVTWSRSACGGRFHDDDDGSLRDVTRQMSREVRSHSDLCLPVVGYYKPSASDWTELHQGVRRPVGNRFDGYRECLSPERTGGCMREWVHHFTLVEMQRGMRPMPLQAINNSVAGVMGISSMSYDVGVEDFLVTMDDGSEKHIEDMYDESRIVRIIANIAWRASVLNPFMGVVAPSMSSGVVLIDCIDSSRYPRVQSMFLDALRRSFPRMQLIVTTYTPSCLGALLPGSKVVGRLLSPATARPDKEYTVNSPFPFRGTIREIALTFGIQYEAARSLVKSQKDTEDARTV